LGDVAVVPLVHTARPAYRATASSRSTDREVVVMSCNFVNRDALARDRLPQDLLYLLTLYGEALCNAIRAAGGTFITVGTDGIDALFGLECKPTAAAQGALQAAGAIECAVADLGNRLGREGNLRIALGIHFGRAVIGEIGPGDPPALIVVGEALDVANELRKAAAAQGKALAISEAFSKAAGVDIAAGAKIILRSPGSAAPITASLFAAAPVSPPRPRLVERATALQRLWSG
jgi:adenylate cyclase